MKSINEASQNALHFFANVIWSSWNINALNMECCFYATEKKIRKVKFLLYVIKTMYHREFMEELVYSICTVLNHVFLRDIYETIQIFVYIYDCKILIILSSKLDNLIKSATCITNIFLAIILSVYTTWQCTHSAFERSLSIYELEPTHTGDRRATKIGSREYFSCFFKHDLLVSCCEKFAFQITSLVKSMKEKS